MIYIKRKRWRFSPSSLCSPQSAYINLKSLACDLLTNEKATSSRHQMILETGKKKNLKASMKAEHIRSFSNRRWKTMCLFSNFNRFSIFTVHTNTHHTHTKKKKLNKVHVDPKINPEIYISKPTPDECYNLKTSSPGCQKCFTSLSIICHLLFVML